jgi:hypothetical protein
MKSSGESRHCGVPKSQQTVASMNRQSILTAFVALIAIFAAMHVKTVRADCPAWLEALNPFAGTPVDVHSPTACETCCPGVCIDREKVEDCVCGEKKLYKTSVHKEYVAIPEVRYRWEMKCVTKEIPCDFCKPVCKSEDVDHQYQVEHWEKQDLPCGGEQYCKSCETQTEKLPMVNGCHTEPGKTTVTVHYLSCVKVPYTVYRQVEKEVGVKQPCYELVSVPVTRHVCCCREGMSCESCQQGPVLPNSASGGEPPQSELPTPEQPPQP